MTESTNLLGKKIFFLYPSAVVQNRIIEEFVQQDFEVYLVKDHSKIIDILKKYPDSVVFVNIADGMSEGQWESWIRGVQGNPATSGVGIGIISAVEDEAIREKYLAQVKIRCGFMVMKSDLGLVMKQFLEVLKAVDAKGRRKYIRMITGGEANTTVNLPWDGGFLNGTIKDISAVGFSCVFEEDPELTKNALFQNIQIRLQSVILKAEGIVFGSRVDSPEKIYVILFTQKVDPETRAKIRRYIQSNLQAKLDTQLR